MPEQVRPVAQLDGETVLSIRAWNIMGGIDWAALPVIAEMLGIGDIETLVLQLVAIRDAQRERE
mgnify:FL=1